MCYMWFWEVWQRCQVLVWMCSAMHWSSVMSPGFLHACQAAQSTHRVQLLSKEGGWQGCAEIPLTQQGMHTQAEQPCWQGCEWWKRTGRHFRM